MDEIIDGRASDNLGASKTPVRRIAAAEVRKAKNKARKARQKRNKADREPAAAT